MNLKIKVPILKELVKTHKRQFMEDALRYKDDSRTLEIEAERFTDSEIDALLDIAQEHGETALARQIKTYMLLLGDPSGTKVTKLEALQTALRQFIGETEHKWLFRGSSEGQMLPYYVTDIAYVPGQPHYPAHVVVNLGSDYRGEKKEERIHYWRDDLKGGKLVSDVLKQKQYFRETPALVDAYLCEMDKYSESCSRTGAQFLATGFATISDGRWWSTSLQSMERDGIPTRVVMDDQFERKQSRSSRSSRESTIISDLYWTKRRNKDDDEDEQESGGVALPVHPFLQVYDLREYRYVEIHVTNLASYVYDETIGDKLVLPKPKRDLIDILVRSSGEVLEDIVRGKTGGVIVIATGSPGTGKTLSAEVFAEIIHKPLYTVQCSQLGTNPDALEKELTAVLERATRWQAILLLDEADVYVKARGNNIKQNANVGVFLRVLEYYRGVLFMTSNRETEIDDAIMSRATAWIRYEKPEPEELVRIWTVLAEQFNIVLAPNQVEELLT